MSKSAPKQAVVPQQSVPRDADGTGRFRIDESRRGTSTMLPPPVPKGPRGREDVISLEALGGLLESELEPVELDAGPGPARGLASGVFSSESRENQEVADEGSADLVTSLRPYYREDEGKSERAELQFEDFSLRLDNPYVASSLVPPPRAPISLGRVLGTLGIAAAGGLVAVGAVWLSTRPPAAPHAVHAVVAPSQPAAVAAAPVAVPEAPIAAVAVVAKPAPVVAPKPSASTLVATTRAPAATRPQAAAAATRDDVAPNAIVAPQLPAATEPAVVAASAAPVAPTETSVPSDVATPVALPEAPTREQVMAGFNAIESALTQCAAGKHGIVTLDATIANSGRVSYAVIAGAFKGTPAGSCMARAARAARFPQFSQPSLKVSYPVSL
jgi:hypothetical protein